MKRIYTNFHFLEQLLYNHYKNLLNESKHFLFIQHFLKDLYSINNNLHLTQQNFLMPELHLY
jgi:hypothetical protein